MSGSDDSQNTKKPRATYSPLILLALGIGAYAYYNVKPTAQETIPDLDLSSTASAQSEPQAEHTTEDKTAIKDSEEPAVETPDPKQSESEQQATPAQTETAETTPEPEKLEQAELSAVPDLTSMTKPRTLGSPDAPIKIVEHASFTCPHCAHFHEENFKKLVTDYVDTGKAQIIFIDFPMGLSAVHASMVSRCVPEKNYFNFVRLLFQTQREWTSSPDYKKSLKQSAMIAGLPGEAFDACINNENLQKGILSSVQEAVKDKKIDSVPTLVINGAEIVPGNLPYEELKKILDAELAASSGGQ